MDLIELDFIDYDNQYDINDEPNPMYANDLIVYNRNTKEFGKVKKCYKRNKAANYRPSFNIEFNDERADTKWDVQECNILPRGYTFKK